MNENMQSHSASCGHAMLMERIEARVRAENAEALECSSQMIDNLQSRIDALIVKNAALKAEVERLKSRG